MIKEGYTRVTEILQQWDRFGEIKQKMPGVLEKKAELGSNVHSAIKAHFEGIYFPLSEKEQCYFDSFLKWCDRVLPIFSEVEERLYDDVMMITGAIDSLVRLLGSNELMLVDYKTSATADPKFWPLQAGFYYMLAKNNGKDISNRVLFIQLDKEGKRPKVHEYIITKEITDTCLAALKTYRYFHS